MKFTGERCILGKSNKILEKEHLMRYKFANKYVTNKKVLDIACGAGYGAGLLAAQATEVIGVDISKEAINYAKKHHKKKNLKFQIGDATNLDFLKNKSFSVILSFETIEHILNYNQYLKEMYRLLRDNGIYIVSTPNKKYSISHSNKPINPFHVIEFYLWDFEKLLKKYFPYVKLYGQDPQTRLKKIKQFVIRIIPKRIRQTLISSAIREKYNAKQISGIIDKNIGNCKYFIAICRK